jgi:predicted transcriptional regulator
MELKIIEYFLNNKENKTENIAKHFKISNHKASRIINDFLKDPFLIKNSKINGN